jgi:hypothetical protein
VEEKGQSKKEGRKEGRKQEQKKTIMGYIKTSSRR